VDLETEGTTKRRRGRELEDALLDAAWEQLISGGYGAFTFDAVAERAGTSKPVIYRRWPNREALVIAAIRRFISRSSRPVPDTGGFRGDVIALMTQANETRGAMAAVISVQLATYYQESGTTPAELREQLLGERTSAMEVVVRRALERGEITVAQLPPRIMALPFDLFRHEALMTLKAVPVESIVEIVDNIFLPLIAQGAAQGAQPSHRLDPPAA
jgi:AcrR family transcriptional regulator